MTNMGYSGTPLAKKLGIKEGFKIRVVNEPDYYFMLFTDFPQHVSILNDRDIKKNMIHFFTKDVRELADNILQLKDEMEENGMLWVSWPKKASGIVTDITEQIVRKIALENGLVDVKVCAVDQIWSGLKLVIPVKDRKIDRP